VRQLRSALKITLASITLLACGPNIPAARPFPQGVNTSRPELAPKDRVKLVSAPGRPTLQMIRRQGDPKGAIAVAAFPPGGSVATLLLGALLELRLKERLGDREAHLKIESIGLLYSIEVNSPEDGKGMMDSVYDALANPVEIQEAALLQNLEFLTTARQRVGAPSPYRKCMGQLGAEGADELIVDSSLSSPPHWAKYLEKLRKESFVSSRIGLSALGSRQLLSQVAKAHDRSWAKGPSLHDSWSGEEHIAVIESEGGRELRLALRVADSTAALSAARSLKGPHHSLHSRLHALDPHLHYHSVQVSLRPAGACIGLTITLDEHLGRPSAQRIAQAAILATDEMGASMGRKLSRDEGTLTLLAPQGALEAAALAAWTAPRSPTTTKPWDRIVEYRSPPGESLSPASLSTVIEETKASWARRRVHVVAKKEAGQGELWMMLASTCGMANELPEDSGLRALTVSSLAADFSGLRGVTLSPWVSTRGVGLVAHGAALRGETAKQHARRLARSLASAFSGSPLDGRDVASMRAAQLIRIGSDPGITLVDNILGAGHPSMVSPWGNEKTTGTASTADVERTRADMVQEPLLLAILENSEANQKKAAQTALSRWLAPSRQHPTKCEKLSPSPPAPGTWTLETIDEGVQEATYIGVWSPTHPVLGRATAYLLNRPGGYIDKALHQPGLAANAEARWLGDERTGGLVLRVSAERHLRPNAVQQIRGLLENLSQGHLTPEDLELVQGVHQAQERALARTSTGRLVQLWQNASSNHEAPPVLSLENLRRVQKGLNASQHRVVNVRQRE